MKTLKLGCFVFILVIILAPSHKLSSKIFDDLPTSTTKDRELLLTVRNSNCLNKEQTLSDVQYIIESEKDNSGLTLLMVTSALGDFSFR